MVKSRFDKSESKIEEKVDGEGKCRKSSFVIRNWKIEEEEEGSNRQSKKK